MKVFGRSHTPESIWLWLSLGWMVIIVKCLMVPWVIQTWHIPIGPFWVIIPTLIFAVVVTALVLTRWNRGDPKG